MPRFLDKPNQNEAAALEALQEKYRAGHETRRDYASLPWYAAGDNALPIVPHPSEFQADPLVIGGGENRARLAMEAKRLLDLDPGTKERAGSITYGPTRASMLQMSRSGLPMDRHGGTTLQGITGPGNNIGLMDESDPRELRDTLGHEIAHVAGWGEKGAREAGGVAQQLGEPTAEEKTRASERTILIDRLQRLAATSERPLRKR